MSQIEDNVPPEWDRQNFKSYLYGVDAYDGQSPENFQQAWQSIEDLDFVKALEKFEALAEKGDRYAQTNAGGIYEAYPPVKNIEKANAWYEKAIVQGSAKAMAFLGLYHRDEGEPQKAFELLNKAVSMNDMNAYHNLAGMYAHGIYVKKDIHKAIELQEIAAKNTSEMDVEPGYRYFLLGDYYQRAGDEKTSRKMMLKAIDKQHNLILPIFQNCAEQYYDLIIHPMVPEYFYQPINEDDKTFLTDQYQFWEEQAKKLIPDKYEAIKQVGEQHRLMKAMEIENAYDTHLANKGRACFIATAVYDDIDAPELAILRNFRDKHLMTNKLGIFLVRLYYKYSPNLARKIEKKHRIKKLLKKLAFPVIVSLVKSLK